MVGKVRRSTRSFVQRHTRSVIDSKIDLVLGEYCWTFRLEIICNESNTLNIGQACWKDDETRPTVTLTHQ